MGRGKRQRPIPFLPAWIQIVVAVGTASATAPAARLIKNGVARKIVGSAGMAAQMSGYICRTFHPY